MADVSPKQPRICGGGKVYCVACSNYAGKIVEGQRRVTLHSFPTDKQRRRAWVDRVRLVRKHLSDGDIKPRTRICSEHFVHKKGPQQNDDVPSVFSTRTFKLCSFEAETTKVLHDKETENQPVPYRLRKRLCTESVRQQSAAERATSVLSQDAQGLDVALSSSSVEGDVEMAISSVQGQVPCVTLINVSVEVNDEATSPDTVSLIVDSGDSTTLDSENNDEQLPFRQSIFSMPACSVLLHDYTGSIDPSSIFMPSHCTVSCQAAVSMKETSVQTEPLNVGGISFFGKSQGTQTNNPSEFSPLRYEHLAKNDDNIRIFTGLPNAATFEGLFNALPKIDKTENRKALRLIDQFLMTLMRLKLGLLIADLSFRFGVSKTTCSDVFNKWIDWLHVHLSFLTYWPTREQIDNTMPSDFKERFPRTRVIIDCTELITETPQSLAQQSLMYSQYKSHMTWKALIGITPNGVVSFVSDLWAGSISDKQIVIKSGIIDKCEKGDAIMGDKGFLIADLTTPRCIDLIVPPKKNKDKQMSERNVTLTRRVANCRIHVERHMQRVKKFRILQNLTGTMKGNVSKIWKNCNHLTALLPPLHPHNFEEENDHGMIE